MDQISQRLVWGQLVSAKNDPLTSLCKVFKFLSRQTAEILDQANYHSAPFSEESLTDINLLSLHAVKGAKFKIRAHSRRDEGLSGADWEWWFCRDASRGLGVRVQAKRLNHRNNSFDQLWKKSGEEGNLQIDNLINNAKDNVSFPLYCFYCGASSLERTPIKDSGCSIASAYAVQARAETKLLTDLLPIMQPWENLVCPGNAPEASNMVPRVYSALQKLSAQDPQSSGRAESGFFESVTTEGIQLPTRVVQVLEGRPVIDEDPTLAGMIVLQDSTGQQA